MKDTVQPCHHTLSDDDIVYKEVVVIGNGPSGMVTSFMLAGNVPYLKELPPDLPIDEMLRARLSNLPPGQSLFDVNLAELAEGLEGRSHNPIPLLMDNLLRPCADLGIQGDSLIEWRFDIDKQISHVVVGRGPAGGAWHSFPAGVRTLSPAAWLALPPHAAPAPAAGRVRARAVAAYCRRYVRRCNLQRYFRTGATVTSVRRAPAPPAACDARACPRRARWLVSGYDARSRRAFRYLCARVVVACGGGDRPNALPAPRLRRRALARPHLVERAVRHLARHLGGGVGGGVLVVGSGVSAADAVRAARAGGARVLHAHRAPAAALARLAPALYPDYCQVHRMMCDGPAGNHHNYTSLPEHAIIEVTALPEAEAPRPPPLRDVPDEALAPKRVRLLNLLTDEITEVTVNIIAVLIGSKPDLHFLNDNFSLNYIDVADAECACGPTKSQKRNADEPRCFLRNHWHYLKCVIGQGIQSCKLRYLNYTEINGNTEGGKCSVADCNKRAECACANSIDETVRVSMDESELSECGTECTEPCKCDTNPYSDGIGFGVDEKKPVDCRSNPVAIDKGTHEMLNAPKGMYALGPLTADNFIRFIPGGALALVSHIHREHKSTAE